LIFFLDENFPRSAAEMLRKAGHTIFDIRGTDDEGLSDEDIFNMAQKEHAIFLTTDRDFYHTIPWLFVFHYGVIIINLSQPNAVKIIEKLHAGLVFITKNPIENCCLMLTDRQMYYVKR
jgi:predicted nuclease of predicted toxin-antitoxin system